MALSSSSSRSERPSWRRRGLFRRFRPRRRDIILLAVIALSGAGAGAIQPFVLKSVIDHAVAGAATGTMVFFGGVLLVAAVVSSLAGVAASWATIYMAGHVTIDLRDRLLAKMHELPLTFYTYTNSTELVTRVLDDSSDAPLSFARFLSGAMSTVMGLIFATVALAILNLPLAMVCVLFGFASWPLSNRVRPKLMSYAEGIRNTEASLRGFVSERLRPGGAITLRSSGRGVHDAQVVGRDAAAIRGLRVRSQTAFGMLGSVTQGSGALLTVAVFGIGGWSVIRGRMTLGSLVAFAAYGSQVLSRASQVPGFRQSLVEFEVKAHRVFELLEHDPVEPFESTDGDGSPVSVGELAAQEPAVHPRPVLSFVGVWFRYPHPRHIVLPSSVERFAPEDVEVDRWVVRDVTFSVAPGQLVALVGPSGAGKSTVAALAAALYKPTRGAVTLETLDSRSADANAYRARVGVVSQETFLFHASVRDNVTYGCPGATEAQVIEACEAAHIHHVIAGLPEGYYTTVGEHGFRLSGGEKQRVGLARMLLRDPELVILDEATAHLDNESERVVQRALAEVLVGRSSLVIAHRLSTIQRADQILVLDDGAVVERGDHHQLLAANGRYTHLWQAGAMEVRAGQAS